MHRIVVLGNANSGAKVANYLHQFLNPEVYQVKYYYEYKPHSGYSLENGLDAIKIDKNSLHQIDLEDANLVFSCGWTHRLESEIVDRGNCYNIHPAILPKYRGINPIERQLSDATSQMGITLHRMDHGFDTGPVFAQVLYSINSPSLMQATDLVKIGIDATELILRSFFDAYPNIVCIPQSDPEITLKAKVFKMEV